MNMKFAFYADDFTGATDTLATLARAGQKVVLFLNVPQARYLQQLGQLDAIGIAGAARAMDNQAQVQELSSAAKWMASTNADILHYKTCSTFDSSAKIGSIGVAVQVFKQYLGERALVSVVGGQPNLGRYCVFGNVFAAFAQGGEVYRLDRHPTMSQHPSTPMHEADLRLHLAQQGLSNLGLINYTQYKLCADDLTKAVKTSFLNNADGVVFDVAQQTDLLSIGQQICDLSKTNRVLAIGPSSVAGAVLSYLQINDLGMDTKSCASANGPVLVFSGSMSPLNKLQLESAKSYIKFPINVSDVLQPDSVSKAVLIKQICNAINDNKHVLVYLDKPKSSIDLAAPADIAKASAKFLRELLCIVRPARLGLAGGDTSSYAIRELGVWGISYIAQIDPGVALCKLHADDPQLDGLQIMLKGGQMGSIEIFNLLYSGK